MVKKLLAVVLAAMLLCGVFAVGVSAAGDPGSTLNPVYARNRALQLSYYTFCMRTDGGVEFDTFYKEWKDALLPNKNIDDFEKAYRDELGYPNRRLNPPYWQDNVKYEEDIAVCHAILVEHFNSDLIQKFEAWRDAYVSHNLTYSELANIFHGIGFLDWTGGGDNLVEPNPTPEQQAYYDEYRAIKQYSERNHRCGYNDGDEDLRITFAEATAQAREADLQMKTLINKINNPSTPAPIDPNPNPNPDPAPTFVAKVWNFILRWFLFGWIWMK